ELQASPGGGLRSGRGAGFAVAGADRALRLRGEDPDTLLRQRVGGGGDRDVRPDDQPRPLRRAAGPGGRAGDAACAAPTRLAKMEAAALERRRRSITNIFRRLAFCRQSWYQHRMTWDMRARLFSCILGVGILSASAAHADD